jgi:hypothetical protein
MGATLWIALIALKPALSRPDLTGFAALLGLCVLGAAVHGGLAVLLGVLNLADLRFLRRQPNSATPPADPA